MSIILIVVVLCGLYVLSTVCRLGECRMHHLYGWKYAHRGFHGNGIPENSMKAFRKAKELGYGVELDVHLLADGNLAVIHDSKLKRTTGSEGVVEELTTEQLAMCFLEGTNQTIPQLKDVLELFDGCAPLIVELKPVGSNYAELCEKACALLDQYKGAFCIESFDPRCVFWLRKHRPDLIRGQLTENFLKSKTSTIPLIFKLLMTFQMLNFLTRPDFVAYKFKDRNHLSNQIVRKYWNAPSVSWTITNQKDLDISLKENSIPIFESFNA